MTFVNIVKKCVQQTALFFLQPRVADGNLKGKTAANENTVITLTELLPNTSVKQACLPQPQEGDAPRLRHEPQPTGERGEALLRARAAGTSLSPTPRLRPELITDHPGERLRSAITSGLQNFDSFQVRLGNGRSPLRYTVNLRLNSTSGCRRRADTTHSDPKYY